MGAGEELRDEGMRLYREGRYEDAAAKFAEAQAAFLAADNLREAAEAANNRGVSWRQAARWAEAHAAFEEARRAFQSIDSPSGEGQVVGNMGSLADSEGNLDQAEACYREAVQLLESAGERDLAQATYTALSRLQMRRGNWLGALTSYESGLSQVDRPGPMHRLLRKFLGVPRRLSSG